MIGVVLIFFKFNYSLSNAVFHFAPISFLLNFQTVIEFISEFVCLFYFKKFGYHFRFNWWWWYSLCPMSGLNTRSLGLNTLDTT